jgi:hypothetical protein
MRSPEEVALVIGLVGAGLNDCEIARRIGGLLLQALAVPVPAAWTWERASAEDRRPAPPRPGAVAFGRVPGAELGERDGVSALPLQQRVGGHPGIFGRACDQLGIEWRPNNPFSLSVARRGSVAPLDEFVGPKR